MRPSHFSWTGLCTGLQSDSIAANTTLLVPQAHASNLQSIAPASVPANGMPRQSAPATAKL